MWLRDESPEVPKKRKGKRAEAKITFHFEGNTKCAVLRSRGVRCSKQEGNKAPISPPKLGPTLADARFVGAPPSKAKARGLPSTWDQSIIYLRAKGFTVIRFDFWVDVMRCSSEWLPFWMVSVVYFQWSGYWYLSGLAHSALQLV